MKQLFSSTLVAVMVIACCYGSVSALEAPDMRASLTLSSYNVGLTAGDSAGMISISYDVQSNKLMPVNTFVSDYEVPEANAMEDNSGIISETEALEIIRNSEKKAEEESSEELNMSSEEGKTDDNTEEEIFDDSSEEPEISESGDTAEVIEFPKDSETEEENDGTEITEEDSERAEELPVEDIYEGSEELGLAG